MAIALASNPLPLSAVPSTSNARLETLVDDLLIDILSLLPVWDVLRLRQTSKRMEALSHARAVWSALFARDVLKSGRPVPGFAYAPTPRLLQLFCALGAADDLYHTEFDAEVWEEARELIEARDLEARTVHALRLEKYWRNSTSESCNGANASSTRLRTFHTMMPLCDVFLLPGGRFVVSVHSDRLCCWDLGVPHSHLNSNSKQFHPSMDGAVRCVGEWILPCSSQDTTICMDARAPLPSVFWCGVRSACFALCPEIPLVWNHRSANTGFGNQKRTCEILSVRLDPLRPHSPFEMHIRGVSSGSPFATPVPFFRHEADIRLPTVLPTPVYPESTAASVPEEWGPHRFANGKLGRILHVYGKLVFFESFVPAPIPADGTEEEEEPKYVGIEVLDWTDSTRSVLFEYPDPQVGSYVGMHVHASAHKVLVVWQNCAGLYPIPPFFPLSSLSSSSGMSDPLLSSVGGSAAGSTVSSRPSTPALVPVPSSPSTVLAAAVSGEVSKSAFEGSGPARGGPSLGLDASRGNTDAEIEENDVYTERAEVKADIDVTINNDTERGVEEDWERIVTMPTIVFALSEPVEAPVAFSLCDVDGVESHTKDAEDDEVPPTLTILARSKNCPTRNVQSVLTASPSLPSSEFYGASSATNPNALIDKWTFRLSRIPVPMPPLVSPSSYISNAGEQEGRGRGNAGEVAALALGASGRGVRADVRGALYRCNRVEVVLPRVGYGFGSGSAKAIAVPTVDFSPWRLAGMLPSHSSSPSPSSSSSVEASSPHSTTDVSSGTDERQENTDTKTNLVLRFDDGMGRVVSARVPQRSESKNGSGIEARDRETNEVIVLDFA